MLPLAVVATLAGLVLVLWGIARGEWTERLPSGPEPHWRLTFGAIVFVGGTLVTVATVAMSRLETQQVAQSVNQPVLSSDSIKRVSELPGTFH
jgi:hypothetical protein